MAEMTVQPAKRAKKKRKRRVTKASLRGQIVDLRFQVGRAQEEATRDLAEARRTIALQARDITELQGSNSTLGQELGLANETNRNITRRLEENLRALNRSRGIMDDQLDMITQLSEEKLKLHGEVAMLRQIATALVLMSKPLDKAPEQFRGELDMALDMNFPDHDPEAHQLVDSILKNGYKVAIEAAWKPASNEDLGGDPVGDKHEESTQALLDILRELVEGSGAGHDFRPFDRDFQG